MPKVQATILLVEDEEMVRRLAYKVLVSAGYRVYQAASGEEALQVAQEHQAEIDLLLTDVMMPRMNGKEVCRSIRKMTPDLRVLYMSGYTEDVIDHRGFIEDGIHFIQKPFSIQSLKAKVAEVLSEEVN